MTLSENPPNSLCTGSDFQVKKLVPVRLMALQNSGTARQQRFCGKGTFFFPSCNAFIVTEPWKLTFFPLVEILRC